MRSLLLTLVFYTFLTSANSDYALRDGDTVAFLGDSITAARGYPKLVENYTLLRFPKRHIRFFNAGQGGDTTLGALARLEKDVFDRGATAVTVALGVNDIGWGMKADAEHKQAYLDGIRGIVEACNAREVRVWIASPAITAEDPEKAEEGFLQAMADEGLALASSLGAGTIDLQRGMREIQRRVVAANDKETDPEKKVSLHATDGIHLNDLGQLAMGYALLKGSNAPAQVSSVVINSKDTQLVSSSGCEVTDIMWQDEALHFTRHDEGLPLNLGILGGLNYRFIPIPDGLSQYLLTLQNLPPGDYELQAEGRLLGKLSAERLHEGVNIASMTADAWEPGGPWDAQAGFVQELTDARDKLHMSKLLRDRFLNHHPDSRTLDEQFNTLNEQLEAHQRASAKPYPYHFTVRPTE